MSLGQNYKDSRILVTGGAGFIGSHLCERLLAEGAEVISVDNYFTGSRKKHRPSPEQPAVRGDAPRRDVSALCRGRRHLQSGLPGLPDPLPARSRADHQDQRPRRHQHAGPRQAAPRPIFQASTSEVYGDPAGASAAGRVLGQRQPDRDPVVLRRGQALRRNPVLRLLAATSAADQGGAHLQYLRPADAARRRPGGVLLHRPGAAGRADHRVRRRRPDPFVLLCGRPRRGHHPADVDERKRARGRSISATIPNSQFWNWRKRSSNTPAPNRSWSTSRCRRTIRASASRTSPRRRRISAGSRKWRWPTA